MTNLLHLPCVLLLAAPVAGESDGDWVEFDRELAALAASLIQEGGGPGLHGQMRAVLTASDARGGNVGGLGLSDARLGIRGGQGSYGYRLEMDFADDWREGTLGLLDAAVDYQVTEGMQLSMGRFRAPVSSAAGQDIGKMNFQTRSSIACALAARQGGLMLQGRSWGVQWSASMQNGSDSLGQDLLTSMRLGIDLSSGLLRAPRADARTTSPRKPIHLGLAHVRDHSLPGAHCTLFEVRIEHGAWDLAIDLAQVGPGGLSSLSENPTAVLGPDTSPHSISLSWDATEDWRFAVRSQNSDTHVQSVTDVALTRFLQGQRLKWTLGLSRQVSGELDTDTRTLTCGLSLAF